MFINLAHIPASNAPLGEATASLAGIDALSRAAAAAYGGEQVRDAAAALANPGAVHQAAPALANPGGSFDQGAALQEPANVAKLADPHSLAIYVRKGTTDNERWLSFRIPEGIDQFELLEAGFALDGNQAVVSISQMDADSDGRVAYTYPVFDPKPSWEKADNLPDALHHGEIGLATYLKARGFNVTFR